MIEQTPFLIWKMDHNLQIRSLLQTETLNALADRKHQIFAEAEITEHIDIYHQALSGQSGLYENLTASAPYRIEIKPLKDTKDQPIGCIAFVFHISRPRRNLHMLLEQLQNVSNELAHAPTFDSLCRQSIQLGLDYLGFDRLAIWLVDDDPHYIDSMYGTDEEGKVRDERPFRRHIESIPILNEALKSERNFALSENTLLYNHLGEIISQDGWSVAIGLWNGHQRIGWLVVDNLIHGHPLSKDDIDLLQIYSSLLGHLCTLKRVEEALKTSQYRFRSIFEGASIGIAVIDQSGNLLSHNAMCYQIFDYNAFDFRQKSFWALLSPESREKHWNMFNNLLKGKIATWQFEEHGVKKSGDRVWLNVNMSAFPNPETSNNLVVAFVEDVTKRKRIEEQTREVTLELDRVKLLTDFVQSASHDFRTPLAIINTSLYLLEKVDSPEKRAEQVNKIAYQVQYITALVDGLISIVKWDSGAHLNFELTSVNLVIQDVEADLSSLADAKAVTVVLDLESHLPLIQADRYALREAISNLLRNALQYTPNNGTVNMRTFVRDYQLVIEISDTGIGIDQADLPHIFQRLYRADKARTTSGIGLGLPIAKKIVEGHGGKIEVVSSNSRGSTFQIWLPLAIP